MAAGWHCAAIGRVAIRTPTPTVAAPAPAMAAAPASTAAQGNTTGVPESNCWRASDTVISHPSPTPIGSANGTNSSGSASPNSSTDRCRKRRSFASATSGPRASAAARTVP